MSEFSAIIGTNCALVPNYYTFSTDIVFWSNLQLEYPTINELLHLRCDTDIQRAVRGTHKGKAALTSQYLVIQPYEFLRICRDRAIAKLI